MTIYKEMVALCLDDLISCLLIALHYEINEDGYNLDFWLSECDYSLLVYTNYVRLAQQY